MRLKFGYLVDPNQPFQPYFYLGGQELLSHEVTPVPYYIILLAYIYSLLTLKTINLFGVKSYDENHAVRMQIKHLAYFTYFFSF